MRGEGAAVLEDNASLFAGRWGRNWEVACTLASPTLDERDAKSLCEFKMIHSLLSESIGRLLVRASVGMRIHLADLAEEECPRGLRYLSIEQ